MKLTKLFTDFFESEKAAGFILLGCTIVSLIIANSAWGQSYAAVWHFDIGGHSAEYWINDALMTIFFLLIGLELERELYIGELSSPRNALLPVFGALGGMLVPAAIYLFFTFQTNAQNGAGIPMATDIAFTIGMLSLLGKRVPPALKVFLTALAVIDDLGAILVIAFFYSKGIVWMNLGIALGIFGVLLVLNRLKMHRLWPYLLAGVVMWYFMWKSGVHPTITGVMLAFAIPFGSGGPKTISYKLQHFLHKPVSFIILPIFALANTGIVIPNEWTDNLLSLSSVGIILGLVVGKPLGILIFCLIAVFTKLGRLPAHVKWGHITGAGMLAGIGFTMSIFITLLAFTEQESIVTAKIAVLAGSAVSVILGLSVLRMTLRKRHEEEFVM